MILFFALKLHLLIELTIFWEMEETYIECMEKC